MTDSQNADSPDNFISLTHHAEIRIERVTTDGTLFLQSLGAIPDQMTGGTMWKLIFAGEYEAADVLSKLNRAGFLFVGGPSGWPPAEVFEDLRERGLEEGTFTEVIWSGPGRWTTRVR